MRATEILAYYNKPEGREPRRVTKKRGFHYSPGLFPPKAPEKPTPAAEKPKPAAPTPTVHKVPTARPTAIAAIPPLDVFKMIFGKCHPDSVIATGWINPNSPGADNRKPSPLSPVPVHAMEEWLPEIFNWQVTQTQYMIPNTLQPGAVTGKERGTIAGQARLQWFRAKGYQVRELCAIVLDLDVWEDRVAAPWHNNPQEALLDAMRMWFNDKLPAPAMAALSGRGAYLVFLLRDELTGTPPEATRDNIAAWNLIAAEIAHRTYHLGADGTHPVHWYKRPGTVDMRTGNDVKYMLFGTSSAGMVQRHSLSEMQAALGVYHHHIDTRARITSRPPARPGRQRRRVKRGKGAEVWRCRVEEIERLNQHRHGFRESSPSREKAIWLYYHCLRAQLFAEYPKDKRQDASIAAYEGAFQFAQTFQPPMSQDEISNAVDYPMERTKFWAYSLAAVLGVTEQEATALDLQTILPPRLFVAKRDEQAQTLAARRNAKAERTAKMDRLILAGVHDAKIAQQVGVNRSTVLRRRRKVHPRQELPTLPY